jgi:hypothetical protein
VALQSKQPKHQPRFEIVHGDESAQRWSPKARVLFIVGASVGLWLLIALIVAIIIFPGF